MSDSMYPKDTLARWWCELNVFRFPSDEDFPFQKPKGWNALTEDGRKIEMKEAWDWINDQIPYPRALYYWNGEFRKSLK